MFGNRFLEKEFKLNPDLFRVVLDSGAHTIFNFMFAGESGVKGEHSRVYANYDYMKTAEFKKYLDAYIEYLLKYGSMYDFYVTLDIIGNPQASWEVTEYMESFGLHPMPVYHFGEDESWIKKMLDKYDYIGIGGLGQDITKDKFIPFADRAFKILCDNKGRPLCKTHGFAIAASEIFIKYPWYTADASTWTALSRNGAIYLPRPRIKDGKVVDYDYCVSPLSLATTQRRLDFNLHVDHLTPMIKSVLQDYLERNGMTLQQVKTLYHCRDILNLRFFKELEAQAKPILERKFEYGIGGNVIYAGTPSGASTNKFKLCNLMADLGITATHRTTWLGSFYYKANRDNHIVLRTAALNGTDLRDIQQIPAKVTQSGRAQASRIVEYLKTLMPRKEKPSIKRIKINGSERTLPKSEINPNTRAMVFSVTANVSGSGIADLSRTQDFFDQVRLAIEELNDSPRLKGMSLEIRLLDFIKEVNEIEVQEELTVNKETSLEENLKEDNDLIQKLDAECETLEEQEHQILYSVSSEKEPELQKNEIFLRKVEAIGRLKHGFLVRLRNDIELTITDEDLGGSQDVIETIAAGLAESSKISKSTRSPRKATPPKEYKLNGFFQEEDLK